MKNFYQIILILFITGSISAQSLFDVNPVPFTPAKDRLESYKQKIKDRENSFFKNIEFRSAGPVIMSGRVVDVAVNPKDPTVFIAAYASGGLWLTTNNGISFEPIFDSEASLIIGSIAVDWDKNIIYAGTGENNSSRSSYSGTGVYKSTDLGKSWNHLGLEETHRTGKVLINPFNSDIVFVGAQGHLYSPNAERGVYKSSDGGKSFRKTLYIDENTGVADMVMEYGSPKIIYASVWHRERRAWNFVEKGNTSGIYKSTDEGETWSKISDSNSGFPDGNFTGRIGLTVSSDSNPVLYALVDNHTPRPQKPDFEKPLINSEMLQTVSNDELYKIIKENSEAMNEFLRSGGFPEKYNVDTILTLLVSGKISPLTLYEYVRNEYDLFNTQITGGELYKSTDRGKSWNKTHTGFLDDFTYTYGYYFGNVKVNPVVDSEVYLLGVPLLKSTDGGKSFVLLDEANLHADHHSLWINPNRKGHLINGNDGGINISYDGGIKWFKANTPAVGQCYSVNTDTKKPYNIYTGFQDNGVWFGPSNYKAGYEWYQSGHYPYKSIMGGDGMQIAIDTRENNIVYTGYQFGNYYRINIPEDDYKYITPPREISEKRFRFNWQTPIMISVHNQDIIYFGSNKLFRSMDKCDTWQVISDDLTRGGIAGNVPFGTITTIHESPLKFGLIYTGSDDGLVYVSKNCGTDWINISDGLPEHYWISRVHASAFDTGTVFVSLNGYRWDNFEPLIFKSTDYGDTWQKLTAGLPLEPVNVIREDPECKEIIYAGTDGGVYISINGGVSFSEMFKGIPNVPVHDLVIQPRDGELVIGTHGRSVFIADIKPVQILAKTMILAGLSENDFFKEQKLFFFEPDQYKYNKSRGKKTYTWTEPKPPDVIFKLFSNESKEITFSIKNENSEILNSFKEKVTTGINFLKFDLSVEEELIINLKEYKEMKKSDTGKIYLLPGIYDIEISCDGCKVTNKFIIKK